MTINVSKDDVSRIVEIEERVLDEYRRVLDAYAAIFREFNAVPDVHLLEIKKKRTSYIMRGLHGLFS